MQKLFMLLYKIDIKKFIFVFKMIMYVTKVHELVKIINTKELQNLPFIYRSSKFIFYIQFITSEKSFSPLYICSNYVGVC